MAKVWIVAQRDSGDNGWGIIGVWDNKDAAERDATSRTGDFFYYEVEEWTVQSEG